jgi:hypothetical protein
VNNMEADNKTIAMHTIKINQLKQDIKWWMEKIFLSSDTYRWGSPREWDSRWQVNWRWRQTCNNSTIIQDPLHTNRLAVESRMRIELTVFWYGRTAHGVW